MFFLFSHFIYSLAFYLSLKFIHTIYIKSLNRFIFKETKTIVLRTLSKCVETIVENQFSIFVFVWDMENVLVLVTGLYSVYLFFVVVYCITVRCIQMSLTSLFLECRVSKFQKYISNFKSYWGKNNSIEMTIDK